MFVLNFYNYFNVNARRKPIVSKVKTMVMMMQEVKCRMLNAIKKLVRKLKLIPANGAGGAAHTGDVSGTGGTAATTTRAALRPNPQAAKCNTSSYHHIITSSYHIIRSSDHHIIISVNQKVQVSFGPKIKKKTIN